MSLPSLDLAKVFLVDAADIIVARERSMLIHQTKDIDAAGDEVEVAVREVFARRLPTRYYTGHGHVIDAALHTSPQLDIVIADGLHTPCLFRGTTGTEYFPYESVYGFGEVKSTYDKYKNPIGKFVETTRAIRTGLERKPAPPNYVGEGLFVGAALNTGVAAPYQNPLFTFMLFVDGGNFSLSDVTEIYARTPSKELPSMICILNVGVIVSCRLNQDGKTIAHYNRTPELMTPHERDHWLLLRFGTGTERVGSNLAFLYTVLLAHLQSVRLLRLAPDDYLSRLFIPTGEIVS